MAKIRAYKLAEELGIERNEFVEQAGTHGIELKNAMASLDEDQVELLREKLGGGDKAAKRNVDERRLEGKAGTTVVRRRRKKEPEPEPEPTPEPEPVVVEEPEEVAAADAAEATEPDPSAEEPAEGTEGAEAVPEPVAAEAVADPALSAAPISTPKTAPTGPAAGRDDKGTSTDAPGGAGPDKKGKQRKRVREVVNLQEQEQFARQITSRGPQQRRGGPTTPASRTMVNPRARRRDKLSPKPTAAATAASQTRTVKVQGDISIGELAKQAGLKAPVIQGKLMALGIMVSVNQHINFETVSKLADEMGFEATDVGFKEEVFLDTAPDGEEAATDSANEVTRAPIITVMGHVDHGKTSLLDAIRKTKVTDGEAGGITQHVGAYQVEADGQRLTFIDTPGHAAFTAMRARGAAVTDLVVLVIAATEGPMPQTVEAIEHAQAAGCPIVVAVNKCDLPEADPEKARQRLTEHNLVPEEFGGDVACVNVSAKTGDGLPQLLEMLALQAEILELKADPARRASGSVLEARLDKGRGAVATLLIQDGTLKKGDSVVVGTEWGRVRQMQNDMGKNTKEADPSTPVTITGLSGVPPAGAAFHVVENDRVAKQIVDHREDQERGQVKMPKPRLTLDEFYAQAGEEGPKELTVVLKSDVQGTCEAARDSLEKLSTDEVTLRVLSSGVGAITENDINLASASGTIVLGYNVRPDPAARRQADSDGVEIRTYSIIMEMLDEVKAAMAGLLPAVVTENMLGRAEIRETFTIPKIGTIAGSYILEGKVVRHSHCRVVRDGTIVYTGTVGSLRRFKDDVKEVINGMECGIGVATYNDVKVGDVIEAFELNERPATL